MREGADDLADHVSLAVRRAIQRRFLARASSRLLDRLATKMDELEGRLSLNERAVMLAVFELAAAELHDEDRAEIRCDPPST